MNKGRRKPRPEQSGAVAEVARGIAYWRELRGMTAEQLAQLSGTDCQIVRDIEAARFDPDIDLLDRIACVLTIELIDLFRGAKA